MEVGYRDDMIHQINNEREKIDHMQRDLENIKHIEYSSFYFLKFI